MKYRCKNCEYIFNSDEAEYSDYDYDYGTSCRCPNCYEWQNLEEDYEEIDENINDTTRTNQE